MRFFSVSVALIGLIGGLCVAPNASVQAGEASPFYAGKQIELIVGTGAGGGNDIYARVLAQFMPQYIPGKPAMVVQNMPGADGTIAAAYIYNAAAKDGTIIATSPSSMLLAEAMNPAHVRFDSLKLEWIGTIATMTDVLAVFKSTGVETLADAERKEIVIGGSGSFGLSTLEPLLTNALLGTKFRVVKGYTGGDTVNAAMERHEVEGRTNQWASWKVLRPDWIEQNRLSYLLQYGPRDPSLPAGVPAFRDLVQDPKGRAIVDLLEIAQYIGRSIFAPPGMPEERAIALQTAFDKTMQDPAFIAKMRTLNLEVYPRTASQVRQELVQAMTNRDEVVSDIKARLGLN